MKWHLKNRFNVSLSLYFAAAMPPVLHKAKSSFKTKVAMTVWSPVQPPEKPNIYLCQAEVKEY